MLAHPEHGRAAQIAAVGGLMYCRCRIARWLQPTIVGCAGDRYACTEAVLRLCVPDSCVCPDLACRRQHQSQQLIALHQQHSAIDCRQAVGLEQGTVE